jgi:subtilisin
MARTPKKSGNTARNGSGASLSSSIDELLLQSMQRGDDSLQTGRYIITYKEDAAQQGIEGLKASGVRTADARDFGGQSVTVEDIGDADALVLPEIGVVVVSDPGLQSMGLGVAEEMGSDSPVQIIEPEYFVFADQENHEYLRGFMRATEAIVQDLGNGELNEEEADVDAEALGVTWGLAACRVPLSLRSGAGIRLAVLDTGMDVGHPDFAGRTFVTGSFVGQPVQDLHSHGTHCIGTAAGPKSPPGSTPRYGTAYGSPIYAGKVLSNSGSGSSGSVLAGMNWAIANNCTVISMSLGSQSPVQAAYTAAGQAALNRGCLVIAAAGNAASNTGAPANSPTIMSVASLDPNLRPSSFSNFGKIELAAPGRDVFSSVPRPTRYGRKSGTSMATPHVAGCAALWAQTNPNLRGQALWNRLLQTARPLPLPASRVGRGLVTAPI